MRLPDCADGFLSCLQSKVAIVVIASSMVALQIAPSSAQSAGQPMVHHPIHTASPLAQQQFDQGLAALYAFNRERAYAAFRAAGKADANSPMPVVGTFLALLGDINVPADPARDDERQALVAQMKKLAPDAPENERAYVAAATAPPERRADAFRALATAFPADDDAQVLYAEQLMDTAPWRYYGADGSPLPVTRTIVAVLDRVLARNPRHIGALHLYIHAVEGSAHPERALPAANALAAMTFDDAAEHLAHMPSHIYVRLGLFERAMAANERAIEAMHSAGGKPHTGYVGHDYHTFIVAASYAGMYARALAAADEYASTTGVETERSLTLVRFGRWHDILQLPPPSFETAYTHFARGMALVATGRTDDAERELAQTRLAARSDPTAAFAVTVLEARILGARGQAAERVRLLRDAVARQTAEATGEFGAWPYSLREDLGEALLASGAYREALATFSAALREVPGNGRVLWGVARAYERLGDAASAARARVAFERAWRSADVTMSDDLL